MVLANGRRFLRATNISLRGSSFVAMSAPKRFAGIRWPRPLMHGAVHAIVSPSKFWRLKIGSRRAGSVTGSVTGSLTGMLMSAGPFNFYHSHHNLAFMCHYCSCSKVEYAANRTVHTYGIKYT